MQLRPPRSTRFPYTTLFRSQEGTHSIPTAARTSSFKLWLKYAKPTQGRLVVDAGAARALREGAASLLPVGIVDVDGSRSEEHTSELQSRQYLVCRLLLEKKK